MYRSSIRWRFTACTVHCPHTSEIHHNKFLHPGLPSTFTSVHIPILNVSYGDLNKPYTNRHGGGLAVTLDALSRELDVLFVVPTGNYEGDDTESRGWSGEYPGYLTTDASTLIDPAPTLSALTVGSLARNERNSRRPNDPGYRPVARADQPSPFTRRGPSVNGAIKPDVVDYGGNMMLDARAGGRPMSGAHRAGELFTSNTFAAGRQFADDSGTSFAVPRVGAGGTTSALFSYPARSPATGSCGDGARLHRQGGVSRSTRPGHCLNGWPTTGRCATCAAGVVYGRSPARRPSRVPLPGSLRAPCRAVCTRR